MGPKGIGEDEEARSLQPVEGARSPEIEFEVQVAPPTRLTTYKRGGEVRYEIDRDAADRLYASHPGGVEAFRAVSDAGHAFLERAVRYLTDDAGMRQFLVMGTANPGRANVHEIAQATAPESRAVYVLFDPLMLVYAHRLQRGTDGTTTFVRARLGDTDVILEQAASTLDLSEPVAVIMPANLSYVRSADTAARLVDQLMEPLAAGSHLGTTHHASDLLADEVTPVYRRIAELAAERRAWEVAPRSHAEVSALFERLELVEPGLVPIEQWRPTEPVDEPITVAMYGAVNRK